MKILNKILILILGVCLSMGAVFVGGTAKVSAEKGLKNNLTVSGGTLTESDNGYNGTEAVKLTFNGKTSVLRVKNNEINALKTFDTVTVEFRLKYDGTGYNNTLRVYKAEGDLVDYGYPANVWNRVRFKTMVYTENGENFVKIELDFAANKTAYISDLKVTASEEDKPLLGGVKLISLESITLAMGYVVITPDNKVIVIDGGYVGGDTDIMLKLLRTFTHKVDYWFLTHFHTDHTTVAAQLIEYQDIVIENLYYDFPTSQMVKDLSGDSDYPFCDKFEDLVKNNPQKVKNVIKPHYKDEYKLGEYVTMKVLNNAWYTERDGNYGNNSGIMFKMETPGESVLFTGDMGDRGDVYLNDEWSRKEIESCTLIQMAHHGQHGTSDAFYNAIKDIKVCLYPAVDWIYNNDNGSGFNTANLDSLHTRDLMRERGVMNIYTSGMGRKIIL